MEIHGNLIKLSSELNEPVSYTMNLSGQLIALNPLLGTPISIQYAGQINCIACGSQTKSSFFQGYCFSCFSTLPETDTCVMQPETCRAHEGISRDMDWSIGHCLTDHIVYLALTSATKVGVTRATQVPTRWIDQGAWQVVKLARTPNRYLAGLIEVGLKEYFTDKTSWQRMLKDERAEGVDLLEEKDRAWESLPEHLEPYCIDDDEITEIIYPVKQYPVKVKSVNFDKSTEISGTLTGIRGQYLIFDDTFVFNVRRHNGYLVRIQSPGID